MILSRQYVNFNSTDFFYLFLFGIKLRVFHLCQTNDRQAPYGANLLNESVQLKKMSVGSLLAQQKTPHNEKALLNGTSCMCVCVCLCVAVR